MELALDHIIVDGKRYGLQIDKEALNIVAMDIDWLSLSKPCEIVKKIEEQGMPGVLSLIVAAMIVNHNKDIPTRAEIASAFFEDVQEKEKRIEKFINELKKKFCNKD